jgi:hypothetical protein
VGPRGLWPEGRSGLRREQGGLLLSPRSQGHSHRGYDSPRPTGTTRLTLAVTLREEPRCSPCSSNSLLGRACFRFDEPSRAPLQHPRGSTRRPTTPGPRRRRVRPSSGHSRDSGCWTKTTRCAPHSHAPALRERLVGAPDQRRLCGGPGGLSSTDSVEPSSAEARPNDLELTCAPQDADPGLRGASRASPDLSGDRVRFSS